MKEKPVALNYPACLQEPLAARGSCQEGQGRESVHSNVNDRILTRPISNTLSKLRHSRPLGNHLSQVGESRRDID
ncbi:hypothetical protein J6590_101949, partial [Homalodisca vitripennis]